MYDSLRLYHCWPKLAGDVYNTVRSCKDFLGMGTIFYHHRQLGIFTPSGSLEFVAFDTLGLLPCTKRSNQFMVTITDRYSKPTSAIQTTESTSTKVASIAFNN